MNTLVWGWADSYPSSTKNEKGERDPGMHQAKKGNEWHFGMKLHVGVDDALGLIHDIATTPANAHDITQTENLLHGEEKGLWGDAGYQGVHKRSEFSDSKIKWHIALRPGKLRQLDEDSLENRIERVKASVRAKVEHPFLIIKRTFGYNKVRYRGLAKNTNRLYVLAAFTNLLLARKVTKS
ncbi:MAG: IS5 family transposase [Anaerolineae bacterium]|nr:IS5 family transposase [Anaerolineae bacterium]